MIGHYPQVQRGKGNHEEVAGLGLLKAIAAEVDSHAAQSQMSGRDVEMEGNASTLNTNHIAATWKERNHSLAAALKDQVPAAWQAWVPGSEATSMTLLDHSVSHRGLPVTGDGSNKGGILDGSVAKAMANHNLQEKPLSVQHLGVPTSLRHGRKDSERSLSGLESNFSAFSAHSSGGFDASQAQQRPMLLSFLLPQYLPYQKQKQLSPIAVGGDASEASTCTVANNVQKEALQRQPNAADRNKKLASCPTSPLSFSHLQHVGGPSRTPPATTTAPAAGKLWAGLSPLALQQSRDHAAEERLDRCLPTPSRTLSLTTPGVLQGDIAAPAGSSRPLMSSARSDEGVRQRSKRPRPAPAASQRSEGEMPGSPSVVNLASWLRGGTGPHACKHCGMRFPTMQALAGHQNIHKELKHNASSSSQPTSSATSSQKSSRKRARPAAPTQQPLLQSSPPQPPHQQQQQHQQVLPQSQQQHLQQPLLGLYRSLAAAAAANDHHHQSFPRVHGRAPPLPSPSGSEAHSFGWPAGSSPSSQALEGSLGASQLLGSGPSLAAAAAAAAAAGHSPPLGHKRATLVSNGSSPARPSAAVGPSPPAPAGVASAPPPGGLCKELDAQNPWTPWPMFSRPLHLATHAVAAGGQAQQQQPPPPPPPHAYPPLRHHHLFAPMPIQMSSSSAGAAPSSHSQQGPSASLYPKNALAGLCTGEAPAGRPRAAPSAAEVPARQQLGREVELPPSAASVALKQALAGCLFTRVRTEPLMSSLRGPQAQHALGHVSPPDCTTPDSGSVLTHRGACSGGGGGHRAAAWNSSASPHANPHQEHHHPHRPHHLEQQQQHQGPSPPRIPAHADTPPAGTSVALDLQVVAPPPLEAELQRSQLDLLGVLEKRQRGSEESKHDEEGREQRKVKASVVEPEAEPSVPRSVSVAALDLGLHL